MPEDRELTGVSGLDRALGGGFPRGSLVMVTGHTGTGKTIMGMNFAYNGALKYGQRAVYVSTEQNIEDLIQQAELVGMRKFRDMVKQKKLAMLYFGHGNVSTILTDIQKQVKAHGAQRLVIDSETALMDFSTSFSESIKELSRYLVTLREGAIRPSDDEMRRRVARELVTFCKDTGCTTILISEKPADSRRLTKYGVIEYLVDGLVHMHRLPVDDNTVNALQVLKMRKSRHDRGLYAVKIGSGGVTVRRMGR